MIEAYRAGRLVIPSLRRRFDWRFVWLPLAILTAEYVGAELQLRFGVLSDHHHEGACRGFETDRVWCGKPLEAR